MSILYIGSQTTNSFVITGDGTGNLVIQTGNTATTAVTIDTSQNATFAGKVASAGSLQLATNGGTTALTLDTSQNATFAGKVASASSLQLATNGTTTAVTIDTNQNVGVGVTPSASTSNYRTLQIGGSTTKYSIFGQRTAGNAETFVGWNAYGGSNTSFAGTGFYYVNTGDAATMYSQNAQHAWFIAPTGTAGNAITFTQAMTLNTNGALVLKGGNTSASGVGIAFPATPSASSDANTLDDYEEGTWTVATNGTGNLSSITFSVAKYIKVGRLVQVQIGATYSTSGSGNTYVVFSLPFLMDSAANVYITGTLTVYNVGSNLGLNTGCIVDNSSGDAVYAYGGWYVPSTQTSQTLTICMTYQAGT